MRSYLLFLVALCSTYHDVVSGFSSPQKSNSRAFLIKATRFPVVSTGFDNFCLDTANGKAITPETARQLRRTVYTHDDWKKHRQQDRFFIYLGSFLHSGVYQNQKTEVFLITRFAALICFWNALAGGYTDFSGVQHDAVIPGLVPLGLPLTPFTLSGSSLGLLLSKYCCGFQGIGKWVILILLLPSKRFVPTQHTSVGTKHEKTGE